MKRGGWVTRVLCGIAVAVASLTLREHDGVRFSLFDRLGGPRVIPARRRQRPNQRHVVCITAHGQHGWCGLVAPRYVFVRAGV